MKKSQLINEAKVYKQMQGAEGVPALYWYGTEGGYHIMAMELLGPSLEYLFQMCSKHFSLATVLELGIQMVQLQYIGDRYRE